MLGRHVKFFREQAQLTQAQMSELLKVSPRTIAKFEAEEHVTIPDVHANTCRNSFESLLLSPVLRRCTQTIFDAVPSEFIGIWLVCKSLHDVVSLSEDERLIRQSSELILHEYTARFQCLTSVGTICAWKTGDTCDHVGQACFSRNDRVHKSMSQDSLTTEPLKAAKIVRLCGNKIDVHPFKRMPGRGNHYYNDHEGHSILHIPLFVRGHNFPQPVLLLSLENKLQEDQNGHWQVLKFPKDQLGEAKCYLLTELSFIGLKRFEIPNNKVTEKEVRYLEEQLKTLLYQEFAQEDKFLEAVTNQIGIEDMTKYKTLILQYAGEAYTQCDMENAEKLINKLYEDELKIFISAFDYISLER